MPLLLHSLLFAALLRPLARRASRAALTAPDTSFASTSLGLLGLTRDGRCGRGGAGARVEWVLSLTVSIPCDLKLEISNSNCDQ